MSASEIIERVLTELDLKAPTFAKSIGVGQQRIHDIQSGKTKSITGSLASKIIKTYPQFNINWLLTGKGDMLHKNANKDNNTILIDTEDKYKKALDIGLKMLPEVDFTFAAGVTELIDNSNTITRYWYLPDCEDCEGVARMAGNSMMPMIPPGCELALKRYGFDSSRPNTIAFGNVYGIVVEDEITGKWHGHIKILRRHRDPDMARRYWIAHSINTTDFDDFDIEIALVRGLWVVKQHVVTNILL